MYEDCCRPGGIWPGSGGWLHGHRRRRRRRPDGATTDVQDLMELVFHDLSVPPDVTVRRVGRGRQEMTPPLKVLGQLRRDHVLAGLHWHVILAKTLETSRLHPSDSPQYLPSTSCLIWSCTLEFVCMESKCFTDCKILPKLLKICQKRLDIQARQWNTQIQYRDTLMLTKLRCTIR